MINIKQPFKISARLIGHLGEALISDELIALTELIKNSYDADANFSKVVVDTNEPVFFDKNTGLLLMDYDKKHDVLNYQGKISILDNGNGMSLDIIKNHYLNIATDFKEKKQKISPKYKRISLGNKGLGRLSLQRLGEISRIITKSDEGCYEFVIDWSKFEKENIEISSVEIDINEVNPPDVLKNKNGTLIEVYKLKNIDLWNKKDTFERLRKEALSIVNPFSEEEARFFIEFNINHDAFSSEKYDLEYLRNLSDVRAQINFNSSSEKLIIEVKRSNKYLKDTLNDLVDRMKKRLYDVEIKKDITFDDTQIFYMNEKLDKYEIKFPKALSKMIKNAEGAYYLPGNFSGEILAYDKTGGRFSKEQLDTLKIQNGVKLFRNNFRILPYGEEKNDWMNFTKYSQNVKSVVYKVNTTIGYFYIDGQDNLSKLREMTNRQGLVEDNYGKNFLSLISDLISQILSKDDAAFRKMFNPDEKIYKNLSDNESINFLNDRIKITKIPDPFKNIEQSSQNILDTFSPSIFDNDEVKKIKLEADKNIKNLLSSAKKLESSTKAKELIVDDEREKLNNFLIVVGASFVAESMAHEIHRITINAKESIIKIQKELERTTPDTKRINLLLMTMDSNMNFLSRHANILNVNSYTKRRRYEITDINSFLNELLESLPYFGKNRIQYDINSNESFEIKTIKANLTVSLENIIINSVYWLNIFKDRIEESPTIYFRIDTDERMLVIYDNGLGIDPEVENSLFEPMVSKKPEDEARGYGLYITTTLLNEVNASLSLLESRNKHGRKYKFAIRFGETK